MNLWQLTITGADLRPPFPEESRRREVVRTIARVVGEEVVLFCVLQDQVQLVVICDRRSSGRIRQACLVAFNAVSGVPLHMDRAKPISERRHLAWLAKHTMSLFGHSDTVPVHPALWSGSCFPDLIGARSVKGLRMRLGEALPTFHARDAFKAVGLPLRELNPADALAVRAAGASRVASAVAAAWAVGPVLKGLTDPAVQTLRRTVSLCRWAEIENAETASALSKSARTVQRMAERPVPLVRLKPARLRLALEDAVGRHLGAT